MAMRTQKRLGDLLVEDKIINQEDLDKALRLQVGGHRRLGYLLIKMGIITEEQLHNVLSQQLDLPIITIEKEFHREAKKLVPRYLCSKYGMIPLNIGENNTVRIAMVDPSDAEAVKDIEKYTGRIIRPVLASKSDIEQSIRKHIPWSFKDIFNARLNGPVMSVIAGIALILAVIVALQLYQERMEVKYGKVTQTPKTISYENLELIVGFTDENKISLLGRGAYASGYYSVTFDSRDDLSSFINSRKNDFSTKQLEWLTWATKNPRKSSGN